MGQPRFTTDWFSENIPLWGKLLAHLAGKPHLKFLEIGSWEGRSACWLLQNILTHPTSTLTCIDTFQGSPEHLEDPDWSPALEHLEDVFDRNIAAIGAIERVRKLKGKSASILPLLIQEQFDFVYIDGSHFSAEVSTDALLGWKILKQGGLMVFDDYQWAVAHKLEDRPKPAIDAFLQSKEGEYDLLHKEWQVIVRKNIHTPLHTQKQNVNVVSISWVRNEEDIIETFVRHHCVFFKRMIIVLHQSTDSTARILTELRQEGLPIDVRTDESPIHRQSSALTSLMHEVAENEQVDWILPLDADEFLTTRTGAGVVNALRELDSSHPTEIPWRTYVPTPQDDMEEQNILRRIVHHRSIERPLFSKVIIPSALAAHRNSVLPEGNHILLKENLPLDSKVSPTLLLAHFPVRTENQLRQKIISGWESHIINPTRKPGQAFQWQELYDRCKDSTPITRRELQDIALTYAVPNREMCNDISIINEPVASTTVS
ncbi:MAG: class I SAM-dependent methyltransferase [Patescibacteria group bacterium]